MAKHSNLARFARTPPFTPLHREGHVLGLSLKPLATTFTALMVALCTTVHSQELTALAKDQSALQHGENRVSWQTFGEPHASIKNAGQNQALLVFVRPNPSQGSFVPSSVYVNGHFHSAILPGAYSELIVCAGEHRIELLSRATSGLEPARSPVFKVMVKPNQITYLVVSDPRRSNPIMPLEPGAPAPDLRQLSAQTHAVSRVPPAQNCKPPETKYVLATELLFRFGSSEILDLMGGGETEIMALARKIRSEHSVIDSVQVIGHTDPIGSREANLQLSRSRAETVRNVLVGMGLPSDRVVSIGVGDRQLIVPDCEVKGLSRSEVLLCNQPNRRVEILVRGTQK